MLFYFKILKILFYFKFLKILVSWTWKKKPN